MGYELCESLRSLGLSPELLIVIVSALPVVELRLSIPLAFFLHIPLAYAFPLAIIGNLLPIPFLLLFWDFIARLLSKIPPLARILNWIFERSRRRGGIVEKYGYMGLMLLVAIPLPGTGAWTGSIVVFLFGLPFKKSLIFITLGVLIAGVIVSAICLLGFWAY